MIVKKTTVESKTNNYDILDEINVEDEIGNSIKAFVVSQTVSREDVMLEIDHLRREIAILQNRLNRQEIILTKIDKTEGSVRL